MGHGDIAAQVEPKSIKFDLRDENKKIKKLRDRHKGLEGMEDLIQFHQFVSKSHKKDPYLNQKQKQVESEILLHAFNNESMEGASDADFQVTTAKGKKSKKLLKKTLDAASQIIQKTEKQEDSNFMDIQIQLSKLDKASVIRIACSSKFCLATTNAGTVFSWGENDCGQLGYSTTKQSNGLNYNGRPRRIEALSKIFVIDAACGDEHALILNSQRELYGWGSNKHCQLGLDRK